MDDNHGLSFPRVWLSHERLMSDVLDMANKESERVSRAGLTRAAGLIVLAARQTLEKAYPATFFDVRVSTPRLEISDSIFSCFDPVGARVRTDDVRRLLDEWYDAENLLEGFWCEDEDFVRDERRLPPAPRYEFQSYAFKTSGAMHDAIVEQFVTADGRNSPDFIDALFALYAQDEELMEMYRIAAGDSIETIIGLDPEEMLSAFARMRDSRRRRAGDRAAALS